MGLAVSAEGSGRQLGLPVESDAPAVTTREVERDRSAAVEQMLQRMRRGIHSGGERLDRASLYEDRIARIARHDAH